jgi:hypothetical protein
MKKNLLLLISTFTFSFFVSLCEGQEFVGFDSLSSGMTSPSAYVLALAMKDSTYKSTLYAGGHFAITGRYSAINVAEWVDSTGSATIGKWEPLGTGVDSDVCALQMFNKYLYAGGKFDTAGGIASSHIARWDTALLQWDSLVGTLNGNVYALCVYNNALYVGGDFTIADDTTVNRIAMWNGTAWNAVGKGFDTGAVYALTVSNDTLYAGGSFLKSNGVVVNHIAKLKDTVWDSVGSGTNNTVYALAEYNDVLFVGGAFTQAGGIAVNYIASFDTYYSQPWNSLFEGTNDTVRVLDAGFSLPVEVNKKDVGQGVGGGDALFVGGNFDSAGGASSHYIAAYSFGWDSIGELNGPVLALANAYNIYGNDNFVGGRFSVAKNSYDFPPIDTLNNVATFIFGIGGGINSINNKSSVNVYPNPSGGMFTFAFRHAELVSASQTNVEVYNVLGEQVYSQFYIQNPTFNINLSNQPSGIYFYRIIDINGNLIGEGKLIIQK